MDPDTDRTGDSRIDDAVRRALSSPPGAAERIVGAALNGTDPRRVQPSFWLMRPAVVAATGLLIVAVAIGWSIWWRGEKTSSPRGTITNDGDVIIITMPGGPTTLIGPGADTRNVPAGTASVTLLGEPQ
jgi:hypothetical protein